MSIWKEETDEAENERKTGIKIKRWLTFTIDLHDQRLQSAKKRVCYWWKENNNGKCKSGMSGISHLSGVQKAAERTRIRWESWQGSRFTSSGLTLTSLDLLKCVYLNLNSGGERMVISDNPDMSLIFQYGNKVWENTRMCLKWKRAVDLHSSAFLKQQ